MPVRAAGTGTAVASVAAFSASSATPVNARGSGQASRSSTPAAFPALSSRTTVATVAAILPSSARRGGTRISVPTLATVSASSSRPAVTAITVSPRRCDPTSPASYAASTAVAAIAADAARLTAGAGRRRVCALTAVGAVGTGTTSSAAAASSTVSPGSILTVQGT